MIRGALRREFSPSRPQPNWAACALSSCPHRSVRPALRGRLEELHAVDSASGLDAAIQRRDRQPEHRRQIEVKRIEGLQVKAPRPLGDEADGVDIQVGFDR